MRRYPRDGAARRPGGRREPPRHAPAGPDRTILFGAHAVLEALRNPARVPLRLLATENAARRIAEEVPSCPLPPEIVRGEAIGRLLGPEAVHQGLYLEADPLPGPSLDELEPDALVVALDQVTDPHNVGAILRTAAAFGVDALLTTARHSPAATGVLAKAASGGLEHVPIVTVGNLGDALLRLGERGFRRIGLDSAGAEPIGAAGPVRPAVLVLGAEGKGLRLRTRQCCDIVARLDMPGAIKSLNVSNAAAIALYEISRGRPLSRAER